MFKTLVLFFAIQDDRKAPALLANPVSHIIPNVGARVETPPKN